MDIRTKVIEISKILDELDDYSDTLVAALTESEEKIVDLLHLIEFNKFDAKHCYRVIKELHDVRTTRRKIKNDMETMRIFKEQKNKLSSKEHRQFLLNDIKNIENKQNNRKYGYKVYSEEELSYLKEA